ncbi:permease [Amycolatopsis sp. NPDC051903]|uniref:permease n=1 Tax=Amycolatopsis sp. NPDC051903 TaxID=3363936 RepID=UPI0037A37A64
MTPVWTLMLATAWLDIVFTPLYLTGVETIDQSGGTGYGEGVIHADYTHSLLGALVLSALFGLVAARWLGRSAGVTLGAVAFSHWLLDLVVHRADLPILPGNAGDLPTFGFGLWRFPAVSMTVEILLLVVGIGLYWRAAAKRDPRKARGLAAIAALSGAATVALELIGV